MSWRPRLARVVHRVRGMLTSLAAPWASSLSSTESTRIRLEGRLELLRRTVAQLEHGLVVARRLDFEPLAGALALQQSAEVQDALVHAATLVREDPGLGRIVERLRRLVRTAEERVSRRARKLRLPPAPLAQAARQLADEPLLYAGRREWRWLPFVLWVTGFVIADRLEELFHLRLPFSGLWPMLFVLMSLLPRIARIDVLVTRRRLVLGDAPVPLADVRRVWFSPVGGLFDRPVRLTVELTSGEQRTHELPEAAPGLVAALKQAGLEV